MIGEAVSGYGVAFDETAVFGRVIKKENQEFFFISSTGIGGMSGSAAVADKDGAVIGMVTNAVATIVGNGIPSSWVSAGPAGPLLQKLLDDLTLALAAK